jgi:hypothetical protein
VVVKSLRCDVGFVWPLDGVAKLRDLQLAEIVDVPKGLKDRAQSDQIGEVHICRHAVSETQMNLIAIQRRGLDQIGRQDEHGAHRTDCRQLISVGNRSERESFAAQSPVGDQLRPMEASPAPD